MENPIKLDDLGVPLFSETPISCQGCLLFVVFFFFQNFSKTITSFSNLTSYGSKDLPIFGLNLFTSTGNVNDDRWKIPHVPAIVMFFGTLGEEEIHR